MFVIVHSELLRAGIKARSGLRIRGRSGCCPRLFLNQFDKFEDVIGPAAGWATTKLAWTVETFGAA